MRVRLCVGCGKETVPERQTPGPGQVKYKAHSLCKHCYKTTSPLAPVKDLKVCRGCGELMMAAGRTRKMNFHKHHARGLCTKCYGVERRANAEVYANA